jgi:hypothetical protein
MSGDVRDFNNIETRAVIMQSMTPKEIHAILTETLGNMQHHMPPSKTGRLSLYEVIFHL